MSVSIIAHYTLDTDTQDSVGSHHATANDISFSDGAANFDGTLAAYDINTSYIALGQPQNFGLQNFSVSFWYNPSSAALSTGRDKRWLMSVLGNYGGSSMRLSGWTLYFDSTMHLTYEEYSSHGGLRECTTTTESSKAEIGTWKHVVLAVDGSKISIYVDGNLEEEIQQSRNDDIQYGTIAAYLGRVSDNSKAGGAGESYAGSMDDVHFYNGMLDASEVSSLYAAGRPAAQQSGSGSTGKNYSAVLGVPTVTTSYSLPTANEPSGWVVTVDNGQAYQAEFGDEASWSGPLTIPSYAANANQKIGNRANVSHAGGYFMSVKPSGTETGAGTRLAYANGLSDGGTPNNPASWQGLLGSDSVQFKTSAVYADRYSDQIVVIASKHDANMSGWENRMYLASKAKNHTDTPTLQRLNAGTAEGNITVGDITIRSGATNHNGTHVFTALKREDQATPDAKSILVVHNLWNSQDTHQASEGYTSVGYLSLGLNDRWSLDLNSQPATFHGWFKPQGYLPTLASGSQFLFGREEEQMGGFSIRLSKYDVNAGVAKSHTGIELYVSDQANSSPSDFNWFGTPENAVKPEVWNHIAVTVQYENIPGTGMTGVYTVYLNGMSMGQISKAGGYTGTGALTLGNGYTDTSGQVAYFTDLMKQFRGSISGFTVADTTYSNSQIRELYLRGVKSFGLECSGGADGDGVGSFYAGDNGMAEVGLNQRIKKCDSFTLAEAFIPTGMRWLSTPVAMTALAKVDSNDNSANYFFDNTAHSYNWSSMLSNNQQIGWSSNDSEFNGWSSNDSEFNGWSAGDHAASGGRPYRIPTLLDGMEDTDMNGVVSGWDVSTRTAWFVGHSCGILRSVDDGTNFQGFKLTLDGTFTNSASESVAIQILDIAVGKDTKRWWNNDMLVAVGRLVEDTGEGSTLTEIAVPPVSTALTVGHGIVIRSQDLGSSWELVASNEEVMTVIEGSAESVWAIVDHNLMPSANAAIIDHNIVTKGALFVVGATNGVMGLSQDNAESFVNIDFIEDNISGNNSDISGIVFGGEALSKIGVLPSWNNGFDIYSWNNVTVFTSITVDTGRTLSFTGDEIH